MLALVFSGLLLAGCHSIRPTALVTNTMISSAPKIETSTDLVIDSAYASFISKDRGSALADPQTYYIGPALAELTKTYFKKSFTAITILSTDPVSSKTSEYIIHPKITGFENDVELSEQEIGITLEADVYDKNMKLIDRVKIHGRSRGKLGLFNPSETASHVVNLAIQNSLILLLKEIDKAI